MNVVVDTDTCSAYIKGHPLAYNRFVQYGGRLYISVVTLGELTIWTRRARASPKRAQDVQDLLKIVTPLDVTADVARKFGEVQAVLMDQGQRAPDLDLLIAATALVHGYTVATDNTQDYAIIARVSGLTIVDWLVP
jgi:predicted nucleic acid-binding protein